VKKQLSIIDSILFFGDKTMAESKKTTAIYELLLTRTDETDKTLPHITDFHYLAIIRNPIAKQATYIDAQAMIPTSTLTVIETEIANGRFPQYELTCYQLKDIDKDNVPEKNIQKVFYSTFVVIAAISKQKDNTSTDRPTAEASIPVRMLLLNPIAYQMSKNTGFNKIFGPYVKTPENDDQNPQLIALETLINNSFNPQIDVSQMSSFTDYVIKKYAGNVSNIKQFVLGDKSTLNLMNYSQITVPPTLPEINVPEYIINTYKPFSTPSFWFFDTFNFGNYDNDSAPIKGKIPIWCFLINFFNCLNTFKKIDISKDSDITSFTHLIGSSPFIDAKGIINRPNAMINFISPNMTQVLEKFGEIPKTLMADNTFQTQDSRMTSLKIYYPDTLKSAKDRLLNCMELFTKHIDRIEYYETSNTTPEWLQFGKLYNLEIDPDTGINLNTYIHTPICIVNIFKRRQTRDNTLECVNKYSMLRLVNPPKK
jgi:hypothetical protein